MKVQDIFGSGVMANHGLMDMHSPFRFSRGARGVVHNGVVFLVCFHDVKGFGGIGHQLIIVWIVKIRFPFAPVHQDDMLKGGEFRNNLNDFLLERGTGD